MPRLPDAGMTPLGSASGPVCVPSQVISAATSLPLSMTLVNVGRRSGKAVIQGFSPSTISSGPVSLRLVAISSYVESGSRWAL